MKLKDQFFGLAVAFACTLLVLSIGASLTDLGPWYWALKQPEWKPPDAAFGVIWSLIFSLCAVSAWLAWRASPMGRTRRVMVWLFLLNALLNVFWSGLYFKLQRPDWALFEVVGLWLSIVALIVVLWRHSRWASVLLVPYLLWVSIASVLNLETIRLNGPFDTSSPLKTVQYYPSIENGFTSGLTLL